MDDARIRQLTEEVLSQIREPASSEPSDLESRVTALETAVRDLRAQLDTAATPATTTVQAVAHPSLQTLNVTGGADRCVLEPGKPCEDSGLCRVLGH